MTINLTKIQNQAPELISLAKTVNINLEKKNLTSAKFKVACALDFSRSMSRRYKSGEVQRTVEKILTLAQAFDDDGEIDLFLFSTESEYNGTVTLENFRSIVDRITEGKRMGSTNYHDTFESIVKFFGLLPTEMISPSKDNKSKGSYFPTSSPVPVYVFFLTDGSPDSRNKAKQSLTRVSYAPVFWKFLSIGSESFDFLQKLDDLNGRYIDNADYKHLGTDIDSIPNDELYGLLLDEVDTYLIEAKSKKLIR